MGPSSCFSWLKLLPEWLLGSPHQPSCPPLSIDLESDRSDSSEALMDNIHLGAGDSSPTSMMSYASEEACTNLEVVIDPKENSASADVPLTTARTPQRGRLEPSSDPCLPSGLPSPPQGYHASSSFFTSYSSFPTASSASNPSSSTSKPSSSSSSSSSSNTPSKREEGRWITDGKLVAILVSVQGAGFLALVPVELVVKLPAQWLRFPLICVTLVFLICFFLSFIVLITPRLPARVRKIFFYVSGYLTLTAFLVLAAVTVVYRGTR